MRPIRGRASSPDRRPTTDAAQGARERELGTLRTRVHALEAELETVRDELALLRVDRQPLEVTNGPEQPDPAAAPADAFLSDFSQRERRAVVDIVAAERARVAAERDSERALRSEQKLRARARRVAERAGLAVGQDEALAQLLLEERRRERGLNEEFRAAGFSFEAREALRAGKRELDGWFDAALEGSLGADAAADVRKVLEKEDGRGRRKTDGDEERSKRKARRSKKA